MKIGVEGTRGVGEHVAALASLGRLRRKVASNPAARNPRPAFSAVVVRAGEYARYDREADAYIIPLTALGA